MKQDQNRLREKCYCSCHALENFGWDQKTNNCKHCTDMNTTDSKLGSGLGSVPCICSKTISGFLLGNPDCSVHYPKFAARFCKYCGAKCVEEPREHEFDESTGKQLAWLICPIRAKALDSGWENHSRWVKELVTDK